MAKRGSKGADRGSADRQRKTVVRDTRLLSPVLADYSTLATGRDVVIHSLFQTEIPVGDLPGPAGKVEAVLVGRYLYTLDFLRAEIALFMRQYLQIQMHRDPAHAQGEAKWFQDLIQQQVRAGKKPEQ